MIDLEKRRKQKRTLIILALIGYFLSVFLLLHILCVKEDLGCSFGAAIGKGFDDALQHPLRLFPLPSGTLQHIFLYNIFLLLMAFCIRGYTNSHRHDDRRAIGRAHFMTARERRAFTKKYAEPFGKNTASGKNNIILAKGLYQSLDNRAIGRQSNILLCGGSGGGKTFRVIVPSLLDSSCSCVVTDPSGELYRDYSEFLRHAGYQIRVLSTKDMRSSNHYNPFKYIKSDADVAILTSTLIKNTTPKDQKGGDPFWENSEKALLSAIIGWLHKYGEPNQKNFASVMKMIRYAEVNEDSEQKQSLLDSMFEAKRLEDPDGFAIKQYDNFKMGAAKTLKSILISSATRLQMFDLQDVIELTSAHEDDIDLDRIWKEKTVLFVITQTGDTTFSFITSIMFSQLFSTMYNYCETAAKNALVVKTTAGDVIRVFDAESAVEAKDNEPIVKRYVEDLKQAEIVYNERFDWYEIRMRNGEFVGYRRLKSEAEQALLEMGSCEILHNKSVLPIHTRVLMDEWYSTAGFISGFTEVCSTVRKYNADYLVCIQSYQMLKARYKDEYEAITSNCDTTILLSNGPDVSTMEWINKLAGKCTKLMASHSYGKNGSMSVNSQATDLLSFSDIRELPKGKCLVMLTGESIYYGELYDTLHHPNWHIQKKCKPSVFDAREAEYFQSTRVSSKYRSAKLSDIEKHGEIVALTPVEEKEQSEFEKSRAQAAKEFRDNSDANHEKIIEKPKGMNESKECDAAEETLGIRSEEDLSEAEESIMELNQTLAAQYSRFGPAMAQKKVS